MANITALTIWEKHNTKIFIDFGTAETPDWARLGKSTVFDLAMNPETETFDFIEDATPTELLKLYKPSMAQEIFLGEGDPAFDELFEMYHARPVGSEAIKPVLIVYPKAGTTENTFVAMKAEATISFNNFNAVDKKLSFDMKFSGIVNGTVTFTDGKPTFTADAAT